MPPNDSKQGNIEVLPDSSKTSPLQKQGEPAAPTLYAPPPIEAWGLVVAVAAICISTVPSVLSDIDDVAKIDVMTMPLFEEYISREFLGWTRLVISALIFSVSVHRMTGTGHIMYVPYMKHSKLRRLPVPLDGIRSQMMFTSWSWNTLGLSFALNGLITLLSVYNDDNWDHILSPTYQKILFRASFLIFEMVAPTTMLVSAIVTYVLWPRAIKGKSGTMPFSNIRALLQHNANLAASLLEVGILGRIPMRLGDMALAPWFGMSYIMFTWFMTYRWVPSKEPQFVYFFFDTTLGVKTVLTVLLGLLFVQMLFYYFFTLVDDFMRVFDGGLAANAVVVIGTFSVLCRFKD